MTNCISSTLFCACFSSTKRNQQRTRDLLNGSEKRERRRLCEQSHHIPGSLEFRKVSSLGPELCVYDARELRRRFHPYHTNRDLIYHRRITRVASQDAFSSKFENGRTGRYFQGLMPTSFLRGIIGRYIYANDLPQGCHIYTKPKLSSIEEFFIKTTDSEYVHSYMFAEKCGEDPPEYAILYLHGASGNIGYRVDICNIIHDKLKADVLLIDYRGFGMSSGTPTELGIYMDAQAGLDYLIARKASKPELANQKLIVMGTSLGGAIALHLVSQEDNASLVEAALIENCFTSFQDLSRMFCPNWAKPVIDTIGSSVIAPMFDLRDKIAHVKCPLLFLVGRRDRVIPFSMSTTLFTLSVNSHKKDVLEFEEGGHNDLPLIPNYCKKIRKFLKTLEEKQDNLPRHST